MTFWLILALLVVVSALVAYTAAKVAELKGVSVAELEIATTDNFFRLFVKAERSLCR